MPFVKCPACGEMVQCDPTGPKKPWTKTKVAEKPHYQEVTTGNFDTTASFLVPPGRPINNEEANSGKNDKYRKDVNIQLSRVSAAVNQLQQIVGPGKSIDFAIRGLYGIIHITCDTDMLCSEPPEDEKKDYVAGRFAMEKGQLPMFLVRAPQRPKNIYNAATLAYIRQQKERQASTKAAAAIKSVLEKGAVAIEKGAQKTVPIAKSKSYLRDIVGRQPVEAVKHLFPEK